jgi:hypothetical protein
MADVHEAASVLAGHQEWEDPCEFHGCGKFASDSWRIFCRGERSARGVEDATLLRYLRWLNSGRLTAVPRRRAGTKRPRQQRGARLPWLPAN